MFYRKKGVVKNIARVLLIVMIIELIAPITQSYALTGGPSQPEVQSFEPIGTTDMVDLFSGDFTYNIPLLDVEGYPVNISYHSGIGMEQEASWVGLGWNINVGVINRGLRGLPDDFNGDSIKKQFHMKPELNYSIGVGAEVEFAGVEAISANIGTELTYNNYKGYGVGFSYGMNMRIPALQAGNMGVGIGINQSMNSMEGSEMGLSIQLSENFKSSAGPVEEQGQIGLYGSTGYNSRTGLKNLSYGFSASASRTQERKNWRPKHKDLYRQTRSVHGRSIDFGSYIPIGLQNYSNVASNSTTVFAATLSGKVGSEFWLAFPNFTGFLSYSKLTHKNDGSRRGIGYLYLHNASTHEILDFSREQSGTYNKTKQLLPVSSMTYDIFSVSGQGTGGMFRPFRNDVGTIYDPQIESGDETNIQVGVEYGVGQLFELGADVSTTKVKNKSGAWVRKAFKQKKRKEVFENVIFKQAGERTLSLSNSIAKLSNNNAFYIDDNFKTYQKNHSPAGDLEDQLMGANQRSPRANNISYVSNSDAQKSEISFNNFRKSYPIGQFLFGEGAIENLPRRSHKNDQLKSHGIGEITQVLPDGRTYIYGIPAVNNVQKEASFSVDFVPYSSNSFKNGLVSFVKGDNDKVGNGKGKDHLYQSSITPAYAHSFLLSSVHSSDYVDITGDGPSDDDLGSYHKFNYSMVDKDYRWAVPYSQNVNVAQFSPGLYSDKGDDKGSYVVGSKELWYLHSIESKNFIAEFYISQRKDAQGINTSILSPVGDMENMETAYHSNKSSDNKSLSYQLDSIKLFKKDERILNGLNAIPVKSVYFEYDYSICKQTPNSSNEGTSSIPNPNNAKLTLKKIYFQYGNSKKSMINPYKFEYSGVNPNFDQAAKDRWGNYKPNNPNLPNFEFPYTLQNKDSADKYANAWQLTQVSLPSGGVLNIEYESDDYAYVQDKKAMEMFVIKGVGNSEKFVPQNRLYNGFIQYNYLYFERDIEREIEGKSIKENYLPDDNLLFFNCYIDVANKGRFEPVKGYAEVEAMGICPDNSAMGYIRLKPEDMGSNSFVPTINPVILAGLNYGKYNMPHLLYSGASLDDDLGIEQVFKGLMSAAKEMQGIFHNLNERLMFDSRSMLFQIDKSWIRLNTPGFTKMGGGSRVKQVALTDGWNAMVSGASAAQYGLKYDYTATDPVSNTKISSGVASYEPMIGGDENPHKRPLRYKAVAGRLMPSIELYDEEPIGESYYPGATVGYSKVTVSSIHNGTTESKSSNGVDIYDFYTAKDFPTIIDKTPIKEILKEKNIGLFHRHEKLGVSQGYSIVMNDMHGKPKAIINAVQKDNSLETITSQKFNYYTNNEGRLNNRVDAVVKYDNHFNPKYKIDNVLLAQESDISIDSRSRTMESQNYVAKANLNVVQLGFFPIPIPLFIFLPKNSSNEFNTLVATKIIQQYGILKSIETIDHGAKTTIENTLFDGETGEVLMTKTNNEYGDIITNIQYPAYWSDSRMGGSYSNIHYEGTLDSIYVDMLGYARVIDANAEKDLHYGDELLISLKGADGVFKEHRVWVTGIKTHDIVYEVGGTDYLTLEPRFRVIDYPETGTMAYFMTLWTSPLRGHKNVNYKILRSGNKNLQLAKMGNITLRDNYSIGAFNSLFNITASNRILDVAASEYSDTRDLIKNYWASHYNANEFVNGEKGVFYSIRSYALRNDRKYSDNHSRADGVYSTFNNPWEITASQSRLPTNWNRKSIVKFNNATPNWIGGSKITKFGNIGFPLEEMDASGIYSAAIYGHNYTLPIAVAGNATYDKVKYFGFEDYMGFFNENTMRHSLFTLPHTIFSHTFPLAVNRPLAKTYYKPTVNLLGEHLEISTDAHTGKYAVLLKSNTNLLLGKFTADDYYVSAWIKPPTGVSPSNGSFSLKEYSTNPTTGIYEHTSTNTIFKVTTRSIDGWYKIEGRMPYTSLKDLYISGPANYRLDDVRICPDKANMKSFAYDQLSMRLMAELDENNFATFYEYDSEGGLIRTKKETDKGIITLSETRKSQKK